MTRRRNHERPWSKTDRHEFDLRRRRFPRLGQPDTRCAIERFAAAAAECDPVVTDLLTNTNARSHVVTAVRGPKDGTASAVTVVTAIAAGTAFVVVFGPLTMFIYARKQ